MKETHSLMDGKVHVYRRENSRYWQCSTFLNGRNYRISTKETNLRLAMEFAREWYMAVYVDAKRNIPNTRVQELMERMKPVAPEPEPKKVTISVSAYA